MYIQYMYVYSINMGLDNQGYTHMYMYAWTGMDSVHVGKEPT